MIVRKLTSALIGAGMLIPGIAGALGLGGIELNSGLNQPLDADIQLSRVGDLIEDEIRIKLAGYDEFEKAGVERVFFLTGFKFDVQIKPDGSGVIHLSSKKPVKEPFLNFIIEMQWPQGRLLREYTVLLDPPVFNQQAQLLLIHPPTTNEVAVQQSATESSSVIANEAIEDTDENIADEVFAKAPAEDIDINVAVENQDSEELVDDAEEELMSSVAEGEKKTESFELSEDEANNEESDSLADAEIALEEETLQEETRQEESLQEESLQEETESVAIVPPAPVSNESPSPLPENYGRVARNENLWQIANKVKPKGLTPQQTMLAIKKMNSQAFMNDNINDLKAGYILRLPTYEEIAEIDAQMAVRMVAEQNSQWLVAKNAGKSDSLEAMPLETEAYAEVQPDVDESNGDARLKLLAANTYSAAESGSLGAADGDDGGTNVARIQEKLLQTEEDLDRSELESQELSSRLSDVEAQVKTSNDIIELKDNQIATLQAKLSELEGNAVVPESELSAIDEDVLEIDTLSTDAFQEELQSIDENNASEKLDSTAVDPTPVKEPVSDTPAVTEAASQEKTTELGMVDKVIENAKQMASNPMYLMGGGAALILLLAGGFIVMRKSREDDEFDEDELEDELEDDGLNDDVGFSLSSETASDLEPEVEELNNLDDEDIYMKPEGSDSSETSTSKQEEELEEFHGTAEEAIGEADIYIAYGRHAHAIEILNQVLAKEPGRLDLMKKLLEVYGEMGDETAYAKLEAEINSAEEDSDQTSAAPMSFDADPGDAVEETAIAEDSMSFDLEEESELDEMQANLDAVENDLESTMEMDSSVSVSQDDNEESEFLMEEDDSLTLDDDDSLTLDDDDSLTLEDDDSLTLDEDSVSQNDDSTSVGELENELEGLELEDDSGDELEEVMEFSLDDVESVADLDVDLDLDEDEKPESEGLEFSLDNAENDDEHDVELKLEGNSEAEDLLDNTEEVVEETPVAETEELQGGLELVEDVSDEGTDLNTEIEVDISSEESLSAADDDDDFDFLNDVDEAATKLDLARAYIDMGDKDGARDILEEVITDGDENQKKDANELLQRIA